MTTVTYALSMQCTYPFLPKRIPFLKLLMLNVGFAIFIHQGVMVLVYSHIIVTRELAQGNNQMFTVIASGAVFPLVSFLVRRGVVTQLYRMERGPLVSGEVSYDDFARHYERVLKLFSVTLLLTPVTTIYLNSSLTTVLLAGGLQMVVETGESV